MNFDEAINLTENVSISDIKLFVNEFKKLTNKKLPNNLKLEIRDNLGDPASSYSGSKDAPPLVVLDSKIKSKEIAKRLVFHELVHLITPEYEEGQIKLNGKMEDSYHIGKFTKEAKKINKKMGGGEYIPIKAEKWEKWIRKNEPEFSKDWDNEY